MSSDTVSPSTLPCPFCGHTASSIRKLLRDGYDQHLSDPDAYAYTIWCHGCAAEGGWAKSESGARRCWAMRAAISETRSTTDKRDAGLYEKFRVERTDGTSAAGAKHDGCEYFVLDLTHDPFALPALFAYRNACRAEYPALAADLLMRIAKMQALAPDPLAGVRPSLPAPEQETPDAAGNLIEDSAVCRFVARVLASEGPYTVTELALCYEIKRLRSLVPERSGAGVGASIPSTSAREASAGTAIPRERWHEDDGAVLWWNDKHGEPPLVGGEDEVEFDGGFYTHFTRIVNPVFPVAFPTNSEGHENSND